ncbi:hypothetical protein QUF80_15500 [Desulfococcaceae bacterium HSG8]|nr:hypothetical protein [Desulfococcaceae bacterium HSG8]
MEKTVKHYKYYKVDFILTAPKCFVIYDFEDFAIFPIPHNLMAEILNTCGEKELNLDVNGFLKLRIDNSLQLNIFKPFYEEQITLFFLPLKRLKMMMSGAFLAEQEAEKIGEFWDTHDFTEFDTDADDIELEISCNA